MMSEIMVHVHELTQTNTNVNNDLKQKNVRGKMLSSKIYSDSDTGKKKNHTK